mgnify:CR=1 FL=1
MAEVFDPFVSIADDIMDQFYGKLAYDYKTVYDIANYIRQTYKLEVRP